MGGEFEFAARFDGELFVPGVHTFRRGSLPVTQISLDVSRARLTCEVIQVCLSKKKKQKTHQVRSELLSDLRTEMTYLSDQ